jgi:hypothetical protein
MIEEKVLHVGKEVYVIGNAKDTGVKDDLADDIIMSRYTIQKEGTFIISSKGEGAEALKKLGSGICYLLVGLIIGIVTAMMFLSILDII